MTHVIADDAEAVAVAAELTAKFACEAALRDAESIRPRTELDELSDSGLLGITVPRSHGGAEVRRLQPRLRHHPWQLRRPRRPGTAQPRQGPGFVRRRHAARTPPGRGWQPPGQGRPPGRPPSRTRHPGA